MKERNTKIIFWLIGIAVFFYFIHAGSKATSKNPEDEAKLKAEKAVTVLPSGTENAWMDYVDRRIAATLRSNGHDIQIINSENKINGITYVSDNTPYKISCDAYFGASIVFGYPQSVVIADNSDEDSSDDDTTAYIYGMLVNDDPSVEKSPPLGVNPNSIAALNLRADLCKHISEKVQALIEKIKNIKIADPEDTSVSPLINQTESVSNKK